MNKKLLWQVFSWGVDYGQLLAENERESEEWADAFQGFIIDIRYNMPSNPAPRRKLHSKKWQEAKMESFNNFIELVAKGNL